ncbi:hypothetical protein [Bacillus testis]|uniref:hypothetical protein n=1 Tax=Bacillus testis TaxID=1622072 RepID=UPI00067F01E5|nr:hypothetical protein [Bacillus testis]
MPKCLRLMNSRGIQNKKKYQLIIANAATRESIRYPAKKAESHVERALSETWGNGWNGPSWV